MTIPARPGWRRPADALERSVEVLGGDHRAIVADVVARAGGQPQAFTPDEFVMAVARGVTKAWNKLDMAKGDAALSVNELVVGARDEVGALHAAARKVQSLVTHISVPAHQVDAVEIALGRGVLDYLDEDAAWRDARRRRRSEAAGLLVANEDEEVSTTGPFRYSSACRVLMSAVAVAVVDFYHGRSSSQEQLDAALQRATRQLVEFSARELYSGTAEVAAAFDGARRIVETDIL